jgi:hypothetical protein
MLTVVARSFQAGTGGAGKSFDSALFADKVANKIRNMLRFSELVKVVVIVTNGDAKSPLAENVENGVTPTVAALLGTFPDEVSSGMLIPHICTDWGNNPGSGNALNEGIRIAHDKHFGDYVMVWSPELNVDGFAISQAINFIERRQLSVAGFLRQRWWERPQWNVVQNTGAIWNLETLLGVDGFAPVCNGTGRTIRTEEYGEVPLAGMEDFHACLRMMKAVDNFRWGMVGRATPMRWDVDFEPMSIRGKNHHAKVARQFLVMREYAKMIFPTMEFNAVMDRLFASYHQE